MVVENDSEPAINLQDNFVTMTASFDNNLLMARSKSHSKSNANGLVPSA